MTDYEQERAFKELINLQKEYLRLPPYSIYQPTDDAFKGYTNNKCKSLFCFLNFLYSHLFSILMTNDEKKN